MIQNMKKTKRILTFLLSSITILFYQLSAVNCSGPDASNKKIDSAYINKKIDSAYIKIVFDAGLIQDHKFSFSNFQSNVLGDDVGKGENKLLDRADWEKLHKMILDKYRVKGDTVNEFDNKMYQYGDYKIYIVTSKKDILLINNENDIFYKSKNGIVKFRDKDFGNKIRAIIDYYNYFEKVDFIFLSGSSNFLDKYKYDFKRNELNSFPTYFEVDVKY